MSVFDEYIAKVNNYLEDLERKKVQNRHYDCTGSVAEIIKELPIEVGSEVKPNVILRSDTFMELGNPREGSSSVFLWTDDPAKIKNGKITLFGPEITESDSASMPFGQIFLVGGKKLPDLEHNDLVHNQRVYNEIEGFMVKNSPDNNSWCRISKAVAQKGFSFEILGKAMMAIYRSRVPEAEAIEIVYITSSREDVKQLDAIANKAREISREIVREAWKAKGYDLECNYDCSSCGDQNVCDVIREIAANRAKDQKRKQVKSKRDLADE